jgi:competence protein ComEA
VPPAPELLEQLLGRQQRALPPPLPVEPQSTQQRIVDPRAPSPAPSAPPVRSEPSPLLAAWPRSAQLATAFLLGVAVTLLAVHCFASARSGTRPADLEEPGNLVYRVDLNHAPLAELQQLPGVGPRRAERIAEYRRLHGPFRSVEELRNVPGFGPVALERLRDLVTVGPVAREPLAPEIPAGNLKKRTGLSKKEAALKGVRIDVNRAPATELQRLPGIGPKLSQRILDQRQRARFNTVEDLRRVPGIGPKTLEKLRPYVTVGGDAEPP